MADMNDDLTIFSSRLKELRTSLDLSQKDFAQKAGITAAALGSYESNSKKPSIVAVARISKEFNVSIDWLCGISDKKSIKVTTYADMFRLLKELCCSEHTVFSWEISTEKIKDEYGKSSIFAKMLCEDEVVADFFNDWVQMKGLHDKGSISQELYESWLKDRIRNYEYQNIEKLPFA